MQSCGTTNHRAWTKYLVITAAIFVIALGVAGIVLGEADDSPGLQGLGGALVLAATAFGVRAARKGR